MQLNTLKPAAGSRKTGKRLGRGIGSGKGKTCGKGHKGQKSRAGGYHKVGFEGGQMPLQRRLPKFGFRSRRSRFVEEVRLTALAALDAELIDMELLKAVGLVPSLTQKVKVIKNGDIDKAMKIKGLHLTAGAKKAVEAAGGKAED